VEIFLLSQKNNRKLYRQ